nr:MAG TPA: hypothetical protein [Caudoviricetes sp.]
MGEIEQTVTGRGRRKDKSLANDTAPVTGSLFKRLETAA